MSKDHWISVKATLGDSGEVKFEPNCDELWDGEKFVFNKTKLNMHRNDTHMLKFVLDDRTGLGLGFASFPDDAMWVKEISDVDTTKPENCPGSTDHDYRVIKPLNIIDNGKRLIAKNTNPDHRKWAFSLNFVASDGTPHCWDPIGDNEDGGWGFTSSSLLTYAGVAAGAGIVSALITVAALRGLGLMQAFAS